MSEHLFANTPEPPYYAVIFSSRRVDDDGAAYDRAGMRMVELARQQPGFLGVESARDASGFGITVSYWQSPEAIAAWRTHAEHAVVQRAGRERWYARFALRVVRVERAAEFVAPSA
ncbi:MAG TPA: antibiotic biosynthesis monooxygenase [Solimonas sp.]